MNTCLDLPAKALKYLDKVFDFSCLPKKCLSAKRKEENRDAMFYCGEEHLKESKIIDSSFYKDLLHLTEVRENVPIEDLAEWLSEKGYSLAEKRPSGCFYYPPDGFMAWHTNYKRNDWRIYIVKSLKGDSFFRYVKDDEIVTDYDPKGWSYRIFYVGDEANPFWHCVYGGSGRYSIGFRLKAITAA